MAIGEWLSQRVFNMVHGHNLVYNTCWEDPRLDRAVLNLSPDDTVLVITSAGCNALDYALTGPRAVHAVDMNPRQNALLELKLSAIRNLDYEAFFSMFGHGRLPGAGEVYRHRLRDDLTPWSRRYWDRHIKFFGERNRRGSFYFRGTCGTVAWAFNRYLDRLKLRPWIEAILTAGSVEEQRQIYSDRLQPKFWNRAVRFAMRRDAVLSLLGVPRAQRRQIDTQYPGGVARFVQDCVEAVFTKLPLSDNYFWRVYLTGRYTPECCPEYLKPQGYEQLRGGLADRVHVHTNSVQGFLATSDERISRFVLLDHMDWLSGKWFPLLEAEWQAIVDRAAPNTRILWRSGGLRTDFVDRVRVEVGGQSRLLSEMLIYHPELSEDLHPKCRVHTYGSMSVADLAA